MQLKKLQLLGFKTFADRTEIHIDQGLTAVVGPNGSGKSNIVDALLWVLGEQNPRLLRGDKSQDVIFAGSEQRKPLGMAEVRLVVDNSDGMLPIRFAEVQVTRRIYRSGESAYLLNGAACRLKDITELFLDTGMGQGAYAVVGQNEVDAVLSARPEDRRELFEEAAGIKKYRVRKREALRKLETASAHLQRVHDILRELEEQRTPLEKQAAAARRYLGVQGHLKELEVELLASELQRADYEQEAALQEREQDLKRLHASEADLARLDRLAEDASQRIADAESELDAARQRLQNGTARVERLQNAFILMEQQISAAEQTRQQLETEIEEAEAERKRLQTLLQADTEEKEALHQEEARQREEWAAAKVILQQKEAACAAALQAIEEQQSVRLQRTRERAEAQNALNAAGARLENLRLQNGQLQERRSAVLQLQYETASRLQELQQALQLKEEEQQLLQAEQTQQESQRAGTRAVLAEARSGLETARRILAEQSARLNALTELHRSHEGFYQGVRALLGGVQKGALQGHYRPVVDLLTVPDRYRVAVEVALGGSLQDIVTRTEAEARRGIDWLKKERAGRATFLALPLLRPGQPFKNPGLAGVEGTALDLVGFDEEYAAAVQLLLGRALVASSLDTALTASRQLTGWGRIVTLEGELLSPGGALTGGSLQGRGAHLVGRKGEMDDLQQQIPLLKKAAEEAAIQVNQLTALLQKQEEALGGLQKKLSENQAARASLEGRRNAELRESARLQQQLENEESRLQTLEKQAEQLQMELQKASARLEAELEENEDAEDVLSVMQAESAQMAAARDQARIAVVALEVSVSQCAARQQGLLRSINAGESALQALNSQYAQKTARQNAMCTMEGERGGEKARLEAEQKDARATLVLLEKDLEQQQKLRQEALDSGFHMNARMRELNVQRASITESLHEVELRLARIEVQSAQTQERLQSEYGITLEDGLRMPIQNLPDRQTAQEVARMRRELRAMGQVNTGAVEEFERLTERYSYLSEQQADLEKGRASLLETISEIDSSTREVFLETFEQIKREFQTLFARLFGGGSAELKLTRPDDLLETGIDITAQPPGKKAQSLSLLSGGERSLTATALLFSFLAVRPSPFVLLDEVDAPLDGASVERFLGLVREFSERSQMLIITHNPATMEAAPVWYGITMRQAGVSSVLSYRVPQESESSLPESAVVMKRM